MHQTSLERVGNLVMLTIPEELLETLKLSEGTKVEMVIADQKLVVTPVAEPRYSLAELLSQCDPSMELSEEELQSACTSRQRRELI